MKMKYGKTYKHNKGAVGQVVGKMNSMIAGKCLVMEMYVPGLKPTLQPISMTKDLDDWHVISLNDFIRLVNEMNKGRLDDKVNQIKADSCMRDIAKRDSNDLHLILTLTCGHQVKLSVKDKKPSQGSKFHCQECVQQNDAILKQLDAKLESADAKGM